MAESSHSQVFRDGLLEERVCVVSGAGSGLGRETALELVRLGATVVACGRREEPLAETAALAAELPGEFEHECLDIREEEPVGRFFYGPLERHELPNQFAHSVIPIFIGYIVAHYLTYLVEIGQLTLIQASDPLSNGSNVLGTGDWSVNYWLSSHPTLLASLKVLAVVLGHVVGVVAAHERAVRILPRRHQLTGQLPLLFAMVAFTVGGLYLLFAA